MYKEHWCEKATWSPFPFSTGDKRQSFHIGKFDNDTMMYAEKPPTFTNCKQHFDIEKCIFGPHQTICLIKTDISDSASFDQILHESSNHTKPDDSDLEAICSDG